MINPEEYTVSVRMESVDGERMYVARIQELPDVEEYADTAEFARELALDTIATMYDICQDKGLKFPSPNVAQAPEASGRVTLRLAKSIHAAAIQRAQFEGISLNQFMSNAISNELIKANYFDVAKDTFLDLLYKHEEASAREIKTRDVRNNFLSHVTIWESDSKVAACIEELSSAVRFELSPVRSGARFETLDFDEPNAAVITQAFKIQNRGKRQPMPFAKVEI
ncbi:toxin-antitoxin system HicB family antitoxin [Aeromonas hydrophila]|uniref:toxin-antitoxin system HicB family antitoxin n=1 Tax=Aeromonas hydrophila TaxID=644 RepID=UPI0007606F79|nr:toxin-antitoxin system HicB family antitoxin [Aeromonas hydrophila]KWR69337.1 hypothetical protein ATO50_09275 [Aeromonas hydrophila]HAU4888422.1 toxin-antitoxin system HicB family antitoxin [Aeromonas hydrophila]HAU4928757.1 toxin-antitoxin system HicB family antitoxin [Aeromonas hydrophila]